jgi:ribosomal protein S18 acetylase RimI-like enzyme
MKVKLRKMSELEYENFRDYSTGDYIKDILKEQNISVEEATKQAETEFLEMLPQGLNTSDTAIMTIEDYDIGKSVGVIWYMFEVTDGVSHSFLCDFIIVEEERQKGYATAALMCMENDAKNHGCTESRLYVLMHNQPGVNLYTKLGYIPFRNMDAGIYMRKEL